MKASISIGGPYYNGDHWQDLVSYVQAADRLGFDSVWSAEAWGMEAVSCLGYLAHATENIHLGTGIMQLSSRTPAMTAMTALSLARLSNNRFRLGLGASGPQVVEGLHGADFAKPLQRMREYVDIVRLGFAGERIAYQGEQYQLPRVGGEGKAIRLSMTPNPDIPIYLATLGERSLKMTGELANGWLGTCFIPERAGVLLDPIRQGASQANRSFDDIAIHVSANMMVSDNVEALIARGQQSMAFTLGAMGSAKTNFYNAAISRAGYEETAKKVQSLWISGKRKEALAAIPEHLVLSSALIGDEAMVRARIRAYRDAGVNTLQISAVGASPQEQIAHLEMCIGLIQSECR